MRTLLIYYMTKDLAFAPSDASMVYGLYGALFYLTPLFGGFIADRWLGRGRAVLLGGGLMALGHFLLASETLFYPALTVVALGNGFFLPSLPSQVLELYPPGDPRRDSAFSVYYAGKNLGAFIAPLCCGTIGEMLGWHWGFGVAGAGMCLGLVIYAAGRRYLPPAGRIKPPTASAQPALSGARLPHLGLMLAILAAVVVFRCAYEQTGNSVALWIDRDVDRAVGGFAIPRAWFQALNPLFVFILTPILIRGMLSKGAAGGEASALRKMSLGAGLTAAAYVLLAGVSAWSAATGAPVGWAWALAFFAVFTLGELLILPIGLGVFGRLAPPTLAVTAVAIWYLGSFGGNLLAGMFGSFWARSSPAIFFAATAGVAALAGVVLLLVARTVPPPPSATPSDL